MPIPAVAGIAWLASFLAGVLGSIITYLGQYLTKRIAVMTVIVVVIGTLTLAFFAAINSLVAGLLPSIPSDITSFMSHFIPPNTVSCLSVYFSAQVVRWAYEWNIKIIRMKAQA